MSPMIALETLEARVLFAASTLAEQIPEARIVHGTTRLSQPRVEIGATSLGDRAFFAGGATESTPFLSDRVDILDVRTGKLTTATLSEGRADLAAVTLGQTLIFAGGGSNTGTGTDGGSEDVDVFDSVTRRWSTARLSDNRSLTAGAVSGTKAVIVGNGVGNQGPEGSIIADIYDSATGRWTSERLPWNINEASGFSIGNDAFFLSDWTRQVLVYHGRTGTWSASALPADLVNGPFSGAVVGRSLVVAGITGPDIYDAARGRWTHVDLPRGLRRSWYGPYVAATALGTKVFFAGQFNQQRHPVTGLVLIYDVRTRQWSRAQLSIPRVAMTAITVDNRVLFAGGYLPDGSFTDMVDVFTELGSAGWAGLPRPELVHGEVPFHGRPFNIA